jgi:hypothetical protein
MLAADAARIRPRSRNAQVVLAGSILLLVASYLYPYVVERFGWALPGCIFHRVTGLPCLFCGMTRSFAAMAHLELGAAFAYHLLGPVFFAAVIAAGAGAAYSLLTGWRWRLSWDKRTRKTAAWLFLGLLVATWIARFVIYGNNV